MSSKIEVGSEAYTFGWIAGGGPFNAEGTDAHTVEVLAGKLRTWLFLTGFLLMAACAFCGLGLEQSYPESFADYVGEGTGHFDSNGWSISYDQYLQNWHKEHPNPAANASIGAGVSAFILIIAALYTVIFGAGLSADEHRCFGKAVKLLAIWLIIAAMATLFLILLALALLWLIHLLIGVARHSMSYSV